MRPVIVALLLSLSLGAGRAFSAQRGGALPPLFPGDNWWNVDVTSAPVDPGSAGFITFIGPTRALHPDFGGASQEDPAPAVYGFPYVTVDGSQAKKTVQFLYASESDGAGVPFYPIPDEAIDENYWIEEGHPGSVDLRDDNDRHLLIVDSTNKLLYELYNVYYDGSWHAGSGARFDLTKNDRRPEGWTSADAAGLAILPGLVRYDEVFGPGEINHALRVTVRDSNGYVYPASHDAGDRAGAPPMGTRLRLKASTVIPASLNAGVQKVFRAMKKYGLIVADNGSDMYVSGTYDTRWPAAFDAGFHGDFDNLRASDFEVVKLGWQPAVPRPQPVWHSFFAVNTLETPFVGDFNGDGMTDIITFTRQNPAAFGDVYVALSDGTKFGDGLNSTKWHDFFAINTAEQVVIGDYDGDGKDDIATWLSNTSRQVYVAKSLGTGMGPAAIWVNSIGFDPTDVLAAGDVNADGKQDLVLFARKQGKVYVALSNGTQFAAPVLWHNFFAVSTYERPRVADLNGDGKADIATFATDSPTAFGDVYVAISDGTKFGDKQNSNKWHDFFAIAQNQTVRIGDLDGDGKDDLFTFLPPPQGQCYSILSQGTQLAPNVLWREVVTPASTDVVFTGDVNGDGKADVIVFAQGEGKVYVSLAQ
jgi:hypothetical protein